MPKWKRQYTLLAMTTIVLGVIAFAGCRWHAHSESERFSTTQRQLNLFSGYVVSWAINHDRIPGPVLEDAINAIRTDKRFFKPIQRSCPLVLDGHDAWGTMLIYTVDPNGNRATISSAGSNRKHEHGRGDDITVEMVLY